MNKLNMIIGCIQYLMNIITFLFVVGMYRRQSRFLSFFSEIERKLYFDRELVEANMKNGIESKRYKELSAEDKWLLWLDGMQATLEAVWDCRQYWFLKDSFFCIKLRAHREELLDEITRVKKEMSNK